MVKNMNMISTFNRLMKGFIGTKIDIDWLLDNPEGTLRNASSMCHYKLKNVDGRMILGAYGVSKFTNWCFYEITESGDINYAWNLQEMYVVGDSESEKEMEEHNQKGFDRIAEFGIKSDQ